MSREEKQLSGALRIFEALSGVDEDLLVKCEDADGEGGSGKNIIIGRFKTGRNKSSEGKVNKYQAAGILAAAVCMLAVGITWWSGTPKLAGRDAASTAEDTVTESMKQAVTEAAMEAAPAEVPEAGEPETAMHEMSMATVAGAEAESRGEAGDGSVYEYAGSVTQENGKLGDSMNSGSEMQGTLSVDKEVLGAAPAPIDNRVDITLAEAGDVSVLGNYVPEKLPGGYVWESGAMTENQESGDAESISLHWINGMDSIEIFISQPNVEDIILVDITKPETYDVRLYEIPYGQTVPEKYRESFNNPVFRAADMSLDIVEARMKAVADAGDTDTPRGRFAVLYEDGVLVRFSGRGSAEEIWEMFRSIP